MKMLCLHWKSFSFIKCRGPISHTVFEKVKLQKVERIRTDRKGTRKFVNCCPRIREGQFKGNIEV